METQQTASQLFAGQPGPFGGLTNERELVAICPVEFRYDNPWSNYASWYFFEGIGSANWKWKSTDEAERWRQTRCLIGLLGTFGIGHGDKVAIVGWMLSEMLTEVPEYVPPKKED